MGMVWHGMPCHLLSDVRWIDCCKAIVLVHVFPSVVEFKVWLFTRPVPNSGCPRHYASGVPEPADAFAKAEWGRIFFVATGLQEAARDRNAAFMRQNG